MRQPHFYFFTTHAIPPPRSSLSPSATYNSPAPLLLRPIPCSQRREPGAARRRRAGRSGGGGGGGRGPPLPLRRRLASPPSTLPRRHASLNAAGSGRLASRRRRATGPAGRRRAGPAGLRRAHWPPLSAPKAAGECESLPCVASRRCSGPCFLRQLPSSHLLPRGWQAQLRVARLPSILLPRPPLSLSPPASPGGARTELGRGPTAAQRAERRPWLGGRTTARGGAAAGQSGAVVRARETTGCEPAPRLQVAAIRYPARFDGSGARTLR
ncbi:hypothetical protein PVAP13_8NG232302 [Panicum virgatum]|uniref:Uncharacterized protein n=1 Tax=Panicum virgatum TaxID=38727 RepID=A0A8T0P916_PANVG|nr:hypothetical protein PVAP13_8NG232302 [Panicum virgatum]